MVGWCCEPLARWRWRWPWWSRQSWGSCSRRPGPHARRSGTSPSSGSRPTTAVRPDRGRPGRQPLVHRCGEAPLCRQSKPDTIGRITPAGAVTEFPVPTADSQPGRDRGRAGRQPLVHRVRRRTRSGGSPRPATITEFPSRPPSSGPDGSRPGPDGNLWFTETPATGSGGSRRPASITEFPRPDRRQPADGIAAGPGRQPLVHRVRARNQIGRITPGRRRHRVPAPHRRQRARTASRPGPDGNLWFTEYDGNQIGRITPAGVDHRVPAAHRRQRSRRASRPAPTATSGSPSTATTGSGGSHRPA